MIGHGPLCSRLRSPFVAHSFNDSAIEYLFDADLFFAAAFHVEGAHSLCECLALCSGDRGESLGLEELDAGFFVAEVGFEAEKHDGGCGAEVEDFGVPLRGRG